MSVDTKTKNYFQCCQILQNPIVTFPLYAIQLHAHTILCIHACMYILEFLWISFWLHVHLGVVTISIGATEATASSFFLAMDVRIHICIHVLWQTHTSLRDVDLTTANFCCMCYVPTCIYIHACSLAWLDPSLPVRKCKCDRREGSSTLHFSITQSDQSDSTGRNAASGFQVPAAEV